MLRAQCSSGSTSISRRQRSMLRNTPCCVACLLLLAAAAVSAAVEPAPLEAGQQAAVFGRKLLQPFNLGLGRATRKTTNTAREAATINLGNVLIPGLVNTRDSVDDANIARAQLTTAASNLNLGGAVKSSRVSDVQSDTDGATVDASTDTRSIAQPGFGVTASKGINIAGAVEQNRIAPAAPRAAPGTPGPDPYTGPDDNRPLGSWEVLLSGVRDYGWAGDYDYNLVTAVFDSNDGTLYQYDYDYGQPTAIPESALVQTRSSVNLDSNANRAGAFGRKTGVATAPVAVARGDSRTTGLHGVTAARQNDDIFGTTPVFIPANPFRQSGAQAAGAALARNWKGQLPSTALNTANSGTTISKNVITGGLSDILTYASGTKSSSARSSNVALGSEENIDFDVGRHRRRRAAMRRRRLQSIKSGSDSSSNSSSSSASLAHKRQ